MVYLREKRGFTLVEIMIVVAIISLLITIAIPNLMEAKRQAGETTAQANIRALSTAAEIATNNLGHYPDNLGDLARYMNQANSLCSQPDGGIKGYYYLCSLDTGGYSFQASPVTYGVTGNTCFGATAWGGMSSTPDCNW